MFLVRRHLTRLSLYGSKLFTIKADVLAWYRVLRTITGAGFRGSNGFIDIFNLCVQRQPRNRWHTTLTAQNFYIYRKTLRKQTLRSINRIIYSLDKGYMWIPIQTYNGYSKNKNAQFTDEILCRPYLALEHVIARQGRVDELRQSLLDFEKLPYEEFVRREVSKIKRPQN